MRKMKQIIKFANAELDKFGNNCDIYFHCHGVISRSPAAVCLIFIGWGHDPEETRKFVERMHPQTLIHPEIWSSILKHAEHIKGDTKNLGGDKFGNQKGKMP